MCERVVELRSRNIKVCSEQNLHKSIKPNNCAFNSAKLDCDLSAEVEKKGTFKELLASVRKELLDQSFELEKALNNTIYKMVYEFPTNMAIQCIPEYTGVPAELDGFLYQANFFAKQIPKGESEEPLVQVVMMKMKGKAASLFNRIYAETWEEVKLNLVKLFYEKVNLEEIFHEVETLQQGLNEPFIKFKERALKLKEHIINHDHNTTEDSYAMKNLRIHFLAGLRDKNLKIQARLNKHLEFEELLEFLADEIVQLEQIQNIEERLSQSKNVELEESRIRSFDNSAYNSRFNSTQPQYRHNRTWNTNNMETNHFGNPQFNSTPIQPNISNVSNNFSRPPRYFVPYRSNQYQQPKPSQDPSAQASLHSQYKKN